MKKAVLFPGTGYTCRENLFKMISDYLISEGYDVVPLDYSSIPFKPIKTIDEAAAIALGFSMAVLDNEKLEEAEDPVFVSKSIGCIVSLKYSSLLQVEAEHILLTPTPDALQEISDYSHVVGIVAGREDPLMDTEILEKFCDKHKIPLFIVEGTGHSLKVEDEAKCKEIDQRILHFIFDCQRSE